MRRVLITLVWAVASPLIVAQQIGASPLSASSSTDRSASHSPEMPPGTTVTLVSLEEISSATLSEGLKVRFGVSRDVVVNGNVTLPAGTPIDAVVTRVRRASKEHHRNGSVGLRLHDIDAGGYRIRLTMNDDFAPDNIKHRRSKLKDIVEMGGETVVVTALAPIVIPMGIAMTTSDKKRIGEDLVLKPCFHAEVYVRSAKRVKQAYAAQLPSAHTQEVGVCVGSTESQNFDGESLRALNEGSLKVD